MFSSSLSYHQLFHIIIINIIIMMIVVIVTIITIIVTILIIIIIIMIMNIIIGMVLTGMQSEVRRQKKEVQHSALYITECSYIALLLKYVYIIFYVIYYGCHNQISSTSFEYLITSHFILYGVTVHHITLHSTYMFCRIVSRYIEILRIHIFP
jgi:hypothetical protein